jgi:hypothetical protein
LEHQIPHTRDVFSSDEPRKKSLANDIASGIAAELKPTADVDFTVKQGGKLEKARWLVNLAQDNEWRVPERSLETGRIVGWVEPDDMITEGPANFLFWFSLQIVLNNLANKDLSEMAEYRYDFVLKDGTLFRHDPFRGRILHIPEAAKMRDLIKTDLTLGLSTCVGGQLFQGVLAESPGHKVGLEQTSDAWRHSLRCSGPDGKFLYGPDKTLRPETVNFFTDLTESTDWLCKVFDGIMMIGLIKFTGFFSWYGMVLRRINAEDISIDEIIRQNEDDSVTFYPWRGFLKDGTPMGFQLAKSMLHGSHFAAAGCARYGAERFGMSFRFV